MRRPGEAIPPALAAQTLSTPYAGSGGGGSAPLTGQFLVLAADAGLSVERVFTPGSGLSAVDGGAGAAYGLAVDATIARSAVTITAGAGLTGGGDLSASRTIDFVTGDGSLTVAANDVRVNQGFAFAWTGLQTWSQLATFNAGARIAAGQQLQFGTDVALSRKNTDLLQLATGDDFEAATYTSGFQGWHIDSDGSAEFNNITARGEFHTAVLVYGEIHATAGTFGVFKSAGKLRADLTTVTTPATASMDIEDPDVAHAQLFAVNDIVRLKDGSGFDNWLKVTAVSDQTTFWRYTVDKQSGTNTTFRAGAAVADYGASGAGVITLSADGTFGSAANLSIATHAGAPWTTQTVRARLGNLNGSYGQASDTYGLGLGDYAGGNYLVYEPTGGFVLKAGSGAVTMDSSGVLIDTATSFTSLRSYKFRAGSNEFGHLYGSESSSIDSMALQVDAPASTDSNISVRSFAPSGRLALIQLASSSGGAVRLDLRVRASGAAFAQLFSYSGFPLTGFVIGSNMTGDDLPNAMLDVRGDAIITGGLALGTAGLPNAGAMWSVMPSVSGASSPRMISLTPGSNTAMTVEGIEYLFNAASNQYVNASIPVSTRNFLIQAPTVSAVSAAGVLADAGTLVVAAAPIAGTNMTITRSMALWVQAGWTRLAGGLNVGSSVTDPGAGNIQITNALSVGGNQVVAARRTGYTNAWVTTAAERAAARDAATITLVQLAQRVRAIQEDLHAATSGHGLIGV